MRTLISVMLLLCVLPVYAQYAKDTIATCEGGDMDMLPFVKDKYYFPIAQKITVYSRPDARSSIFCQTSGYADTLRMIEIMTDYPSKFKNIYGYWCKVAFPLKGKRFVGYVPSQFLSRTHVRENNIVYLVNLESYSHDTFVCSLKILNNLSLSYEYRFSPVANYSNPRFERDTLAKDYSGYFGIALCNNHGLKNIERALYVYSGYPACGYWNGNKILMLKNNKVMYTLEDGSVVDGGEYYAGQSYIFPGDSLGLQDTIIQENENYEVITDTTDVFTRTFIKYLWTGTDMIQCDSTYFIKHGIPYTSEKDTTTLR